MTAIEYALLAALLAVVTVAAIGMAGVELSGLYQHICTRLSTVAGGGAC